MMVVTMHTNDYAKYSQEMIINATRHGMVVWDYPIEGNLGWNAVTRLKPEMVEKSFHDLKMPFFWVDVDCEICQPLKGRSTDVAFVPFYRNGRLAEPLPIRSSAIFFNNTPNALRFIKLWKWCTEHLDARFSDHHGLVQAFRALEYFPEIDWCYLEPEYCWTSNPCECLFPTGAFKRTMGEPIIRLGLSKHKRKSIDMNTYNAAGGDLGFRLLDLETIKGIENLI